MRPGGCYDGQNMFFIPNEAEVKKKLTEAQINSLVAYVRSLKK
jgi:hypothetical protein